MLSMRVATVFVCLGAMLASCGRDSGPEFAAKPISERVYVVHGPLALPNKENAGFINNPGFVVTSRGVVIIDPGSSRAIGERLLAAIGRVTQQPVIAVFNTHVHGDHWLGNDAIRRAHPQAVIYAHPRMRDAINNGAGESWIALFEQMTEGAIKETTVVPPDMAVDDGEIVKLGDRRFRIHHTGIAHTDGDIMVEVLEEGVLFLGDNAFAERMPRLDDGHFNGNIAALDAALKTSARHFVPGHGRTGGPEVARNYRDMLSRLYASVEKHYEQGLSDYEMKPKVAEDLAAYRGWSGFDEALGRLVSLAYLQVEAEAFK